MTFEELYNATRRIVGSIMRDVHGMTNPEDIDDCMQSGYLKVWQQLQKNPACFADKPKRYIVQAVVFRSKAQRFSHKRHYKKILFDADPMKQRSASRMTTHQVDTWIDLEQALGQVAHQVIETPASLLGLYCLITQASVQDVATTFGYGYSTLTKKRRQVRDNLAATLDNYGPGSRNGKATNGSNGKASSGLVTTRLFEAVQDPPRWDIERPVFHSNGNGRLPERKPAKPVEKHLAPLAYPTGWSGMLTLEQIINDPQVGRAAFAKARRLGLEGEDLEDCIQQGFIKLWQTLMNDPGLLADKGPVWVGIYVAYSGDSKKFHRHNQRQRKFTDPDFDWQDADEYLQLGPRPDNRLTRADWTTQVDETIDVDSFTQAMIQHFAGDAKKQVALQAVTGAISSQEAAQRLGLDKKNYAASIGNEVRQEVQTLLPDNMKVARSEDWKAQLARGEGTEHITDLAQEVVDDQRLLLALYVVTTSATRKDTAKTFGYGLTTFGKDIRKIKEMIAARYRRSTRTSSNQTP